MKQLYVAFACLLSVSLNAQIIDFPDVQLKTKLLSASDVSYVASDANGSAVAIDANADNEIDVTEALAIYELNVSSSSITDLTGLENFTNLTNLEVNLNDLTNFDGTAFTNLEYLNFSNNDLVTVNVNGLTNLRVFWAFGNPFTSIDLSSLSALETLNIDFCDNLTSLDVSGLANLTDLSCSSNDVMTNLNVSGCTALEDLNCAFSAITSLDVSGLANLLSLFADHNNITTIDVTGAVSLGNLNIEFNQITSLVVHDLPVLQSISADGNLISNFDIQNCPIFFTLVLGYNQLTTLDLSGVPSVTFVNAQDNLLDTLLLPNNNEIVQIQLSNNLLTEIDLNQCVNLNWGSFNNNPNLQSFLIKNGSEESLFNMNIDNLPSLQYVCADTEQLGQVQSWLINEGYGNVNLNTYCSFTPGGEFYEIQGTSRFDFQNDGCTESDPYVPFMSYVITDGVTEGLGVADSTAVYRIPVQDGNYTVTPQSPNPALFDVVPSSFSVNFPTDTSPFVQDICFVPNSVVNDLEVVITPLVPARPGFDATYQVLVRNVGNQTLSGDVTLQFQEQFMTYLESDTPFDASTTDTFTWNFTDLVPFQSFAVNITFTINPPTDPDFPVNIDDILTFLATVTPMDTDADVDNNTFELRQTVVGSFDPNDILCLEGDLIPLADVGKYVHYRIRFENTGTFPAENIVVKNMIDVQKFDMSSFSVVNGSHAFVTQITGNQVEFIMENIQLPFDDANNDGFIVYKIKTLPTLITGDVFNNSAEIFFDFNFPIETNAYATEVVENLGISESVSIEDVSLSPNPAKDSFNVHTRQPISKVQIVNAIGQLVLEVVPNTTNPQINVSNLETGIYMVQITTGRAIVTKKLVKR